MFSFPWIAAEVLLDIKELNTANQIKKPRIELFDPTPRIVHEVVDSLEKVEVVN